MLVILQAQTFLCCYDAMWEATLPGVNKVIHMVLPKSRATMARECLLNGDRESMTTHVVFIEDRDVAFLRGTMENTADNHPDKMEAFDDFVAALHEPNQCWMASLTPENKGGVSVKVCTDLETETVQPCGTCSEVCMR